MRALCGEAPIGGPAAGDDPRPLPGRPRPRSRRGGAGRAARFRLSPVTPRERMAAAMRHGPADRVPVMCQLALGHYFLHAGLDPVDVWHDGEAFAEALVRAAAALRLRRHPREPARAATRTGGAHVERVETVGPRPARRVEGRPVTVCPPDDNPHVFQPDRAHAPASSGSTTSTRRGSSTSSRTRSSASRWLERAVPALALGHAAPRARAGARRQRPRRGLLAVQPAVRGGRASRRRSWRSATDAGRVEACLDARCEATVELMAGHVAAGADAVLVSSAYAGAGFISPATTAEFVLPFEARVVAGFKARCPGTPVYTHTCGAIGDRLELMAETGTDGIDTLDPPPLGDVRPRGREGAASAGRLFLKGNLDPVGVVLLGTPGRVRAEAVRLPRDRRRAGGGYILSTACSVPPAAPPANVLQLRAAAERPADATPAGSVKQKVAPARPVRLDPDAARRGPRRSA